MGISVQLGIEADELSLSSLELKCHALSTDLRHR